MGYDPLPKGKKAWDLWKEAAPNGESPEEVQKRVDDLVQWVKEKHASGEAGDVLIVSHGHISQALVKRWCGLEMTWKGVEMLTPGGIGILRCVSWPFLGERRK